MLVTNFDSFIQVLVAVCTAANFPWAYTGFRWFHWARACSMLDFGAALIQ